MFLHMLDESQQRGLFALASKMMAADRVISDEEVDYLNTLIAESGLSEDEPLRDKGKPVDMSIYDSRRSQLAVAVELLILANVDDHYDPGELILWDEILNHFGFSALEREQLRANAEIVSLLLQNFEALIEDSEPEPTDEERRLRSDRRQIDRRIRVRRHS